MAPSSSEMQSLFAHLEAGEYEKFWEHVDPNVEWIVMGSSVVSGTYHSIQEFRDGVLMVMNRAMKTPVKPVVQNIVAGDGDWAAVELEFNGAWKEDGSPYNQKYAWFLGWGKEGKIVQVRGYFDTAALNRGLKPEEEG